MTGRFVTVRGARRVPAVRPSSAEMASVREWARNAGEQLAHTSSPLSNEGRLAALEAFAEVLGLTAPTPSSRTVELARELTEIADDGVVGTEDADLSLPGAWGPVVTDAELAEAETENLRRAYEARKRVIADSMTRSEAATLIGVSEQAVTKQLDRGRIVGVKVRGQWAIPAWQMDPDSQDGLLPGLERLRQEFPGGPVALSRWATTPSVDLDGQTPRHLLTSNRVDEVIRAANALSSKGW